MGTNDWNSPYAFFETYRETDAGVVKSYRGKFHETSSISNGAIPSLTYEKYLVKDGFVVTGAIKGELTVKVGDFVPHNWLSDDVVGRLAVNFLQPQTYLWRVGLIQPLELRSTEH
ncbi:hypothetical protein V1527DRAFT_486342 [Lipomyces starkeyi]